MFDSVSLFDDLDELEIQRIAEISKLERYARGEIIFRLGDFSRDFFIIKSGRIEISMKDALQHNKVLAILKRGDFFGEMALFDKYSTRSATAQILQNAELYKISGVEFERLLKEKPAISFKMLGTLSKRLKEANSRQVEPQPGNDAAEGRVLTVASARNGFGKTTFASTLASVLSIELPRKVLFIDLDLYYGDGTFVLGVFSPKSILNLIEGVKSGIADFEQLMKHLVKQTDRLYVAPAPASFAESEKVKGEDLADLIKVCRKYFDYIIMDTDSSVGDVLLNALDFSDNIFVLVDICNSISIKSNARFFQGLSHLNFSEDRMNVFAVKITEGFNLDQIRKLFKLNALGGLPIIPNLRHDHGKTLYQTYPESTYVEGIRHIVRNVLKEELIRAAPSRQDRLLNLLFPKPQPANQIAFTGNFEKAVSIEIEKISLSPQNIHSMISLLKTNMICGLLDEAKREALSLVELCPNSGSNFQLLGEIFAMQKDFSLAIDALKHALEHDPTNHIAMGYLAIILSDEAMRKNAFATLQQKLDKNPNYADLHCDRGRLLFLFKQVQEAQIPLKRALEINPKYLEARISLAMTYSELQQYEEGIQELLKIDEKNIRIYYMLGTNYFTLGKYFEAYDAFKCVVEINPSYFDVSDKLITLKLHFDKIYALLKKYQDLLPTKSCFPDIHCQIGNLYLMLGQCREAVAKFDDALRINPNFPEAKSGREKALREMAAYPSLSRKTKPAMEAVVAPPSAPAGPGDTAAVNAPVAGGGSSALDALPETGVELVSQIRLDIPLEQNVVTLEKTYDLFALSLVIKNLRSRKEIDYSIDARRYKNGVLSVDAEGTGALVAGDVLLIHFFDAVIGSPVFTVPHCLTEEEIGLRRARVNVASERSSYWFVSSARSRPAPLSVKCFMVNLKCAPLAQGVSGKLPKFHARCQNLKTGFSTAGKLNPDEKTETTFLFSSSDAKDVIRVGDTILLSVTNANGDQLARMNIPILPEDVTNFSKSIALEVIGNTF